MYIRGFVRHVNDTAIRRYLAAHVRRRRLLLVVRAIAWAIATAIACVVLAGAIDRLIPLPSAVRVVALVITAAVPAATLVHPIRKLFRCVDPVAEAAAIELQHPAFAHRLVTAASADGSPDLRAAVERDVLELIRSTGPARLPLRPTAIAASGAVVSVVLVALLWRWPWLDLPDLTRRLVHPTAGIAAVASTRLTVHPGSADVVEEKPLTISATAVGAAGSTGATLHVSDDGGQTWTDRTMMPAGGSYAVTLTDVDRDLRYTVSVGDAVSPTYDVRVRRVPGVVAVRVRLDYPAALHRPATSTSDLAITAPVGTTATVEIVATVPLERATLSVGNGHIEMSTTADPCARRAQFMVRRDDRIAVQLVSTDGVSGTGARSARVRVQRDPAAAPPGIEQQQRAYRDALKRQ